MTAKKFAIISVLVATAHFLLTWGAAIASGSPAADGTRTSLFATLAWRVSQVLFQPLTSLWEPALHFPRAQAFALVMANSVFWGIAIALAVVFVQTLRGRNNAAF
ncbi:hypothetical protein [Usitatibacter rugosus]|uniref:hypothetical protein n=1 Tax=Usitatibacter rugosus TaxID=2732067 RepID=UPI001487CBC7|nr:hypothetical protein [Usitatibacter rugosus]